MGKNQRLKRFRRREALLLLCAFAVLAFGVWKFFQLHGEADLFVVRFKNAQGHTAEVMTTPEFKLEVARSEVERKKGLMYRKSMQEKHGMLFVYPEEKPLSFWMKNTYIPLDMIFIDSRDKVVGLIENVPVLNEVIRKIEKPTRFAIELNAGEAKKYGIVLGSEVIHGPWPVAGE